ncbi:MAG: Gfo/Idh/MocA family oxidoreductase [bacterium]|nr:Gfo/Idh/MocA family oxidoreductase [bacterium]
MKIGIIGTGAMGKNHLRVVNNLPQLELTCASDSDNENLQAACEPYGNIKQYINYEEMVDDVDGVMVSTPTIYHYEIASFFLRNKKHVLLEKPITNTLDEADRLIRLARENNVTLAVGHLERFNPAVEYIQPFVTRPLFIEIQRLGSFSPRSLDVDVIMDLMIHDLDILLQFDKSGIQQINASGVPIVSDKIDIANARLQFNSKLVANVTASRVSQKRTRKLRVFQKNHYISLDYKIKRVKMFALSNGQIVEEVPVIEEIEPLKNLWNNFYKTIDTGQNFNVTGEDGRTALELAITISERIKKNMEDV